ncbi:hypothetical protein MNBD_ALPHA12-1977 [hydrothermal vent metagenome]|uniref:TNase-like domain-containing protein n=1 Tax=hydrothermal vent metagenome TaxID=652676 RepID=A0A3B0U0J5_9ZZZZ
MRTVLIKTMAAIAMSGALTAPGMACDGLRDGPRAIVVDVVDGDTIMLDNGLKVRLVGIQAPKLALGRDGYAAWPLADQAKRALSELSLGQRVLVRYGGAERDRHGRILGQLFVGENEIWAQQAMLLAGLARVYSFADNRNCLSELYQAEARARADREGIWAGEGFYAIRNASKPLAILERTDRYELVEGRVLSAEQYGQRVYLNFGAQWKKDFTILVERAARRLFEQRGIDPLDLKGALVRVRGWVENKNGPLIEITHPEQIELLAK